MVGVPLHAQGVPVRPRVRVERRGAVGRPGVGVGALGGFGRGLDVSEAHESAPSGGLRYAEADVTGVVRDVGSADDIALLCIAVLDRLVGDELGGILDGDDHAVRALVVQADGETDDPAVALELIPEVGGDGIASVLGGVEALPQTVHGVVVLLLAAPDRDSDGLGVDLRLEEVALGSCRKFLGDCHPALTTMMMR